MTAEPFQGDLRMMTVGRFIEAHLAMFDEVAADVPLAAEMARAIRACLEARKPSLALLLIMSCVMDLGGVAEEAIDLWSPLSARVGAPVAVEREAGQWGPGPETEEPHR